MRHVSLFSGIGSESLAAQQAGFRTVLFCEVDGFCQKVLQKNFLGIPIHGDIRTLDATHLRGDVALLTGGFPCQDISVAGKGAGLEGRRSSLFFEGVRIISECLPLFVLLENSPALRTRGSDRVKTELEGIGYTCGFFVVGAGNAGAPHQRKRVFVVAYSNNPRNANSRIGGTFHNLNRECPQKESRRHDLIYGANRDAPQRLVSDCNERARRAGETQSLPVRDQKPHRPSDCQVMPWRVHQPPIPGVDAGLANRVDRCRALGNTNPPQMYLPFFAAIADHIRESGLAAPQAQPPSSTNKQLAVPNQGEEI